MPALRVVTVVSLLLAAPIRSMAAQERDAGADQASAAADASVLAADAAPPANADTGIAPEVELPRLLKHFEAEYPPEAAAARIEAVVSLSLTIDAQGQVTEAEVVEPVGHGLDEAARTAAYGLRFEPARRQGRPIAARIRYQYRFELPPPAAPARPPPYRLPAPAPRSPATDSGQALRAEEPGIEVTVRGASAAQRLRESAEAVTVVETERAQRESADLGEVLARAQGVSIRRGGGLGSGARFSLNGLTDDQIRFFLDGVPLEVAGFGLGLQNVPVNLVERVEIYRGVVPVRFGADALGGAVNLVSPEDLRGSRAAASAQLGSFGTYRLTLAGRHTHAPTGIYAAFNAFLDHADNDYPVDVEVPDDKGRLSPARVHRFHDAYDAYGGGAEVGLVDRSWAKRLVLRAFGSRQDKELQHNIVMSVPYGEAHYWEATRGATLRYEQPRLARSAFGAHALLAFSRRTTDFEDLSSFVYDWFGRRIRERVRQGEIGFEPSDERIWQHTALARLGLSFTPSPSHALRLGIAPTFTERSGRDQLVTMGRDPLSAERRYFAVVNGLEYQADLFDRRLELIGFGKSYLLDTSSEESLPGGIFRHLEQDSHTLGFGAAVRFHVTRHLRVKASYERATRLPSPDELFGNGILIIPNLRLGPERSHNGNLSLTLDRGRTRAGDFRAEVNAFLRHAENLVVLLGNDMVFSYQNVYTARSQGVETSAGWTSPGSYLAVDGNATWQSLRNRSDSGTFRDFKGDRIPNRPWLFANLSGRVQKTAVSGPGDELSFAYYLRYVHDFFRGWESLGLREFKQVVPAQTTHSMALTYLARGSFTQTWTAEVQNLTDAKVFDFFGMQRPGRAFFVKVTAEY